MQRTLIWDLPTRLFHWALAASFGVAYLTSEGDRWRSLHVFFGYLLLALVAFRLIWGFTGSYYARFASFWFSPKEALNYLKQVLARTAPRHVGHNPTGSIAIYILLTLAVVVSVTGVLTLGGDEQQGIAAGWFTFSQIKLMKSFHELAANGMLLVVLGHIAGVVVESLLHKENLARSMVTGFKMAGPGTAQAKNSNLVAGLMLVTMLGFAGWWFNYAIDRTIEAQEWHVSKDESKAEELHVKFVGKTLPDNAQWRDECGSCHGVFYPALLPARSWEKMMAEQAQHFGSDLGLDDATTKSVLAFMVANSAEKNQIEAGYKIESSLAKSATPLRVTETPYWIKKHRKIAASDWANPLVKSKSNCGACHVDADVGTYEDAAMRIPKAPKPITSAPAVAEVKP
jgi:cytochrome b/nitrate/TMAO reductase-like tetraheme cytochrome c subunit